MANKVFVNTEQEIGEIHLKGDQTADTINNIISQLMLADKELQRRFHRVCKFVDLTGLGRFDFGAEEATVRGVDLIDFDRLAVYGVSAVNRKIIDTILKLTKKYNKIQFFDDRDKAVAWVKDYEKETSA